uniref:Uncharacterized protein n=1 Tax=Physcomitrium patens TaxID=3218 RepID=A0A2K1IJ60_PHYPA|nr:hypothetical protein PHYPA_028007 [Physcomitrium patens]
MNPKVPFFGRSMLPSFQSGGSPTSRHRNEPAVLVHNQEGKNVSHRARGCLFDSMDHHPTPRLRLPWTKKHCSQRSPPFCILSSPNPVC